MKRMVVVMLALICMVCCAGAIAAESDYTIDGNGVITDYRGAGGDIVIPETIHGKKVTGIGTKVFYRCENLTSVEIPEGVTSIGQAAFFYCAALTSVKIPDSVTSIGETAFFDCTVLKDVEIPDSVTSIGGHAFSHCSALTSVTIPQSVTSIGTNLFFDCKSLKRVIFEGAAAAENMNLGCGLCNALEEIIVPCASVEAYEKAVVKDARRFVVCADHGKDCPPDGQPEDEEDENQLPVDLPKTGDNSIAGLYLMLMGLAGAGLWLLRRHACK